MITQEQLNEYLSTLTNTELTSLLDTAYNDLKKVSKGEPNSDWHSECFAAVVVLCQESNKRGIKREVINE